MNPTTTVTALVPAFQASAFIQATLDSLSAQTRGNFDVIVSVDRGDDDTGDICERHARRDPRFRVVRQQERLGWVRNSNFLLEQAQADYALFAFHDDTLLPTYVEKLCAVLDARPEVVLSYSDVLLTRPNGAEEHWVYTELEGMTQRIARSQKVLARAGQWWVPNRGVFRLDAARKIRGLKRHGAGEFSADWPWLLHMSLLGEFARVPETLCHKFYRTTSLSRTWDSSSREQFEVSASGMREIWDADISTEEKMALAVPLMKWLLDTHRAMQQSTPAPAPTVPSAGAGT